MKSLTSSARRVQSQTKEHRYVFYMWDHAAGLFPGGRQSVARVAHLQCTHAQTNVLCISLPT